MSTKSSKVAVVTGILVIAAIAAYWYWSPYLAVRQLQTAAQARDADAFNERVDYPKLRESFKSQFSALMTDKIGETANSGNGFAALGTMLGMALADRMIDALVRPETMMRAIQNGQLTAGGRQSSDASHQVTDIPGAPNEGASTKKDEPKWAYERKSADKLVAYAVDPDKPDLSNSQRLGVVFQRNGFADWKLTEVRLPASPK